MICNTSSLNMTVSPFSDWNGCSSRRISFTIRDQKKRFSISGTMLRNIDLEPGRCFVLSKTIFGVEMEARHSRSLNQFVYLFLFQFCSTLIPRLLQKFFSVVVGDLFFVLMKGTRENVRKNVEGIGQGRWSEKRMEALTRRTFQNYGQYLLDYMVMHRLRPSNQGQWIEEEVGGGHMAAALQAGRGAICITPHLGNWEIGGLLFSFKGGILNVLTLDERDQKTKSFREAMRGRKGIKNVYIDPRDESPMAIVDAVRALRRNEIVAMLGDRVQSQKTMIFDFFGKPTPFPIGVAILALATGAPVLPVFVVMEKSRKYRAIIEAPIAFRSDARQKRDEAIKEGMEKMVKIFEDYIARYPDQWYNFYDYWKEAGERKERAFRSKRE
ncbi:MAG: acyltransferase [Deltaproteobacteria bacterium]|nr:MAG: acyltransferase [Deltaproteobacteria bacterium]